MTDEKLAVDETQRAMNYEAVKAGVKADVEKEIGMKTTERAQADSQETSALADDMRDKVVTEIAQTESEIERGRVAARISQLVDYVFFIAYGLLTLRFLLELFAAREGNAFVQFVKTVSDPIFRPFRGIVASPSTPEGFTLALPIVFAIVVYMLLHLAINRLLHIVAHRKVHI